MQCTIRPSCVFALCVCARCPCLRILALALLHHWARFLSIENVSITQHFNFITSAIQLNLAIYILVERFIFLRFCCVVFNISSIASWLLRIAATISNSCLMVSWRGDRKIISIYFEIVELKWKRRVASDAHAPRRWNRLPLVRHSTIYRQRRRQQQRTNYYLLFLLLPLPPRLPLCHC